MKTRWLFTAVAGIFGAAAPLAGPGTGTAFAQSGHDLRSGRRVGDVDQVQILLEVGGDHRWNVEGKIEKAPMSVVGEFRYLERTLGLPGGSSELWRSARRYEKAAAVIKSKEVGLKPSLRPERSLLLVEAAPPKTTIYSPEGPLSREELDLVDILGNTLLYDALLPAEAVAPEQSWKLPKPLVVALLGLDSAEQVDVESTLVEIDDALARFQLSGHVTGTRAGAATRVELKGKYRLDRLRKRIDWFALLLSEDRQPGYIGPGLDVTVRLQVVIKPRVASEGLTESDVQGLPARSDAELCRLVYESPSGEWRLLHDRRWYDVSMAGQGRSALSLRMIDQGRFIAHCNVSPLPKRAAGRPVELAEFQADVERALGDRLEKFVEAGQSHSDADYRVYRVVAQGKVDDRPVRWTYYLITDRDGRQAALAFSVEGEHVERFGAADRELVEGFRFLPGKTPTKAAAKTEPDAKR